MTEAQDRSDSDAHTEADAGTSVQSSANVSVNAQQENDDVLCCRDIDASKLQALLARFPLELEFVADHADIPGSYWGAPEAGLLGHRVYARPDTPIHSVLHEAGHAICMDEKRRHQLDTEAGGEDVEENAVCYLQILLADHLAGVGQDRLMTDMDTWGYSFRLGSTKAWFDEDAEDGLAFLIQHQLVEPGPTPKIRWRLRSL